MTIRTLTLVLAPGICLSTVAGGGVVHAQERVPRQEALPATPPRSQTMPRQPCIDCHLTLEEERLSEPARLYETDIHADRGFGCLACHGRLGPEGRMDPSAGFLAGMERREIPGLCGSCHSDAAYMRDYNPSLRVDQVTEYVTSVHGQRLIEFDDPDVATCVDCHKAHDMRPAGDAESSVHPLNVADTCGSCHADVELMAERELGTEQVDEFKSGVHGELLYEGGDISAPTCNDCHGNHGAAPPGVGSVQNVCGECHAMMADFFGQSAHAEPFAEEGLPGCATCHGNHDIVEPTDELLATASTDVCAGCHGSGDPSAREFDAILLLLDSLIASADEARAALAEAENLGMEVSQAEFELEEVNNHLTLARTAVHSFHADAVREEVDRGRGTTSAALTRAKEAFQEHRLRRVGLALSAGLIAIVVFGLLYRIRGTNVRLERVTEATEAFFTAHMAGADRAHLRLSASALLLEMAHRERRFGWLNRAHIESLIRERFEIEAGQANELIELGREQRRGGMDPGQFTRLFGTRYDRAQRIRLAEAVWELAALDDELWHREYLLVERISEVLGLTRRQVGDARERVRQEGVEA